MGQRSSLKLVRMTFSMGETCDVPIFVSSRTIPASDDETADAATASEVPIFVSRRTVPEANNEAANIFASWHAADFWPATPPTKLSLSEAVEIEQPTRRWDEDQSAHQDRAAVQQSNGARGLLNWCRHNLPTIGLALAITSILLYVSYTTALRSRWLKDLDRGPSVAVFFDLRCSLIDAEARWLGDPDTRRRLARAGCTMFDLTPVDDSDTGKAAENGAGLSQGTKPPRPRLNPHPTETIPHELSLWRFP